MIEIAFVESLVSKADSRDGAYCHLGINPDPCVAFNAIMFANQEVHMHKNVENH